MIRDLETSLDQLEDSAAEATGYRRSVIREETQLKAQIAELNRNIDFILGDENESNDHLAKPMEARLMGLEESLVTKAEEVQSAISVAQMLDEAVSNLRTKHQKMVAQLSKLEAMERATAAKLQAAKTAVMAGQMASSTADVSVDDVEARLRRRADVADEKFDRAMEGVEGSFEKDVILAQADARLEERKARLAAQKTASSPSA